MPPAYSLGPSLGQNRHQPAARSNFADSGPFIESDDDDDDDLYGAYLPQGKLWRQQHSNRLLPMRPKDPVGRREPR